MSRIRNVRVPVISRGISHGAIMVAALPALFLLLPHVARSEEQNPVLGGEWTATVAAARTIRGKWIGQTLPGQLNEAHGSWTLIDETGRTIMTGTWRVHKASQGWQGTWSAEDRTGRSASGTWNADPSAGLQGSLQLMLELSTKQELAGRWRSGQRYGFWWLKGKTSPPQTRAPGRATVPGR